jgi:hypothetical protein
VKTKITKTDIAIVANTVISRETITIAKQLFAFLSCEEYQCLTTKQQPQQQQQQQQGQKNRSYPLIELSFGEGASALHLSLAFDNENIILHLNVKIFRIKVLNNSIQQNPISLIMVDVSAIDCTSMESFTK